jgi:hypothetical protein
VLNYSKTGRTGKITGQFKYITNDFSNFTVPTSQAAFQSIPTMLTILEKSSYFHLLQTGMAVMQNIQAGQSPASIFNYKLGSRISALGRLHSLQALCKNGLKEYSQTTGIVKEVLDLVMQYMLVDCIKSELVKIFEAGVLNSGHVEFLNKAKASLIEKLTPHILVLGESIDIEDRFLGSAIGSLDANPYENLYRMAKEIGQLNQYPDSIHPSIKSVFLPWRERRRREEE